MSIHMQKLTVTIITKGGSEPEVTPAVQRALEEDIQTSLGHNMDMRDTSEPYLDRYNSLLGVSVEIGVGP